MQGRTRFLIYSIFMNEIVNSFNKTSFSIMHTNQTSNFLVELYKTYFESFKISLASATVATLSPIACTSSASLSTNS
jgi:hypothetical protein